MKGNFVNSETRLSHLQKIAHIGSWELNFASGIAVWSEETCRIYGLKPEENIQSFNSWLSFIHPGDLENVKQEIEKAQRNLSDLSIYHRIILKSGKVKYIHSVSTFEIDKAGKAIGLRGIALDITEQKETEEKLNEVTQRLMLATDSAKIGIYDWDIAAQKLVWDKNMYSIYGAGIDEKESPEVIWERTIHSDDKELLNASIEAALNGTKEFHTTFRIIWLNREIHFIEGHGIVLRDAEGKALRMTGVNRDITEQKLAEQKLMQSKIQIRNFARHLDNLQEEERTRIAREIHEEIAQHLAGLKLGLASIKKLNPAKNNLEEKVNDMLKDVDAGIQSLRKIVIGLRPGILDTLGLTSSIEWLVGEFKKKTHIKCRLTSEVTEQTFDKKLSICFFRICEEALSNISQHANATEVLVSLKQTENELSLFISDNGSGMEQAKLESPFSLGITGMRERAASINARLHISSAKGKGTSIHLIAGIN